MSGNDKQLPPLMPGSFEYDHYIAADYNDYDYGDADYGKIDEAWYEYQAEYYNTSQSSVEHEPVSYITGYERELRGRKPRSNWSGYADIWCRKLRQGRSHGKRGRKRATLRDHRNGNGR